MILSPSKCSVKMSPYEGDGDIEQEGTEAVNSVKPGGDRQSNWQGGS